MRKMLLKKNLFLIFSLLIVAILAFGPLGISQAVANTNPGIANDSAPPGVANIVEKGNTPVAIFLIDTSGIYSDLSSDFNRITYEWPPEFTSPAQRPTPSG